jgi:hypothetical protein
MTAKQSIKARCQDCFGHQCAETTCPLFGLMKPKAGVNRIEAIRLYCQWCMHGNPVNQCASPNCSIYQYRAVAKGNIGVSFLSVSSKGHIDDNGDITNDKTMSFSGTENKDCRNVNSDSFRRAV